jgi:ribosomal protein S18 acetylase RimI-like enzyme
MTSRIRPMRSGDIDDVVQLSLAAWEPVFASFRQVLGPAIYALLYPDWRESQAKGVEGVCREHERYTVWVAEENGAVVGFVAYELDRQKQRGEVQLLAVHPEHQNRGFGTRLNTFALSRMRESGMTLAVVATGGDPGHAPARRSYEKAGYTPLPLVRYYQDLRPE